LEPPHRVTTLPADRDQTQTAGVVLGMYSPPPSTRTYVFLIFSSLNVSSSHSRSLCLFGTYPLSSLSTSSFPTDSFRVDLVAVVYTSLSLSYNPTLSTYCRFDSWLFNSRLLTSRLLNSRLLNSF
jgi:hypothetical protein